MLVVILGAGASYDSDPENPPMRSQYERQLAPRRPPLARELFDPRFNETLLALDSIGEVVPELRWALRQPDGDIEAQLEALAEEATADMHRASEIMAIRFYLQEIIHESTSAWLQARGGVTNQSALFGRLDTWKRLHDEELCLIDFNYDVLLEDALQRRYGVPFLKLQDYLSALPNCCLIKPHGSVRWVRRLQKIEGNRNVIIHSAMDLMEPEDIEMLDEPSLLYGGMAWACVPALAAPLRTKTVFQLPSQHMTRMKECLAQADRVITIGWRGREEQFLREWAGAREGEPQTLIVVTESEAASRQVAGHLNSRGLEFYDSPIHFGEGFSGFMQEPGVLDALLAI